MPVRKPSSRLVTQYSPSRTATPISWSRVTRPCEPTVLGAALGDPDGCAVDVDIDGARRAPPSSLGGLEMVLDGAIRMVAGR